MSWIQVVDRAADAIAEALLDWTVLDADDVTDTVTPPAVVVRFAGASLQPNVPVPADLVTIEARLFPVAGVGQVAERVGADAANVVAVALRALRPPPVAYSAAATRDQLGGTDQTVVTLTATFTEPTC
jgi:hypothetical protein